MTTALPPEWIREPRGNTLISSLRQFLRARSLVFFFARQALLKSTRRTLLGWLWLPLRGVVPTLLGAFLFAGVFGVKSDPVPYTLFLLAGLIPWVLFALTVTWTVRCLEISRRYLRASAFPRLVLPLGFSAPALLDALMFLVTYVGFTAWFAVTSPYRPPLVHIIVLLPTLMAFATGLGWGLILCIPGAQARDVRFTLGFVLAGIFAITPIAYPAGMIPSDWNWLMFFNPLATIINGFRAGLLGTPLPSTSAWIYAGGFALASLAIGLWVFARYEDKFSVRY